MARTSGIIKNFINGVSEQPAAVRLPTQVETQVNAYSTIVRGLLKRFPIRHTAKLTGFEPASAYLHTIDRDATERYEAAFRTDGIDVVTLGGTSKTVNFADMVITSIDAVVATADGVSHRLYFPAGTTDFDVITTGITTATLQVEESTTGDFSGEETQIGSDITTNTTTNITGATSGRWYRVTVSSWTSGTITATITWADAGYLQGTPNSDLQAITVADYTFLVNKSITVSHDPTVVSTTRNPEALVHVVSGSRSKDYKIYIDDVKVAHYTPGGGQTYTPAEEKQASTSNIAQALIDGSTTFTTASSDNGTVTKQLAVHLSGYGTEFIVTKYNNVIHIENVDGNEFTIRIESDGDVNSDRLRVHKGTVHSFTELPNTAPVSFRVRVAGSDETDFDDYYVEHQKDDVNDTKGIWREVVAPGIVTTLDPTTMPHTLVRESDGTFTFGAQTWEPRECGDLTTVPWPSFEGNTINGLYFFKNRLGFMSDENLILSQSGSFFDFFRDTILTILDSDPIDIAANHPKVSIINHVVPSVDVLLVFAGPYQFVCSGSANDELFTPTNVSLDPLSAHRADPSVHPAVSGDHLYYIVEGSQSSLGMEIVLGSHRLGEIEPGKSVSDHCPSFLPTGMTKLVGSTDTSMVAGLSSTQARRIYIYKFYVDDQKQKLQSSWSYYTTDRDILDIEFVDDDLIILTTDGSNTYLETMPTKEDFTDEGDFYVCLDHRVHSDDLAGGSYASGPDETTYTLPYDASGVICVTAATHTSGIGVNIVVNDDTGGNDIVVAGDQTAEDLYFGTYYDSEVQLSEMIAKKRSKDGGELPVIAGQLTLQHLNLLMGQSGYLQAEVAQSYRDTFTHTFTGAALGGAGNLVGAPALEWNNWIVPVNAPTKEIIITLKSTSSYQPWSLLNAEWLGRVMKRGL